MLGLARSGVYCQPFKKVKHSMSTEVTAFGSPYPQPLKGSSCPSSLSVSFSVQTTRLRCRGVTASPGVTTRRRPRFKVTSWRCRRAGPPPEPAMRPARSRAVPRSLNGQPEGGGRATGVGTGGTLTRSMKVRNFQLPP